MRPKAHAPIRRSTTMGGTAQARAASAPGTHWGNAGRPMGMAAKAHAPERAGTVGGGPAAHAFASMHAAKSWVAGRSLSSGA